MNAQNRTIKFILFVGCRKHELAPNTHAESADCHPHYRLYHQEWFNRNCARISHQPKVGLDAFLKLKPIAIKCFKCLKLYVRRWPYLYCTVSTNDMTRLTK